IRLPTYSPRTALMTMTRSFSASLGTMRKKPGNLVSKKRRLKVNSPRAYVCCWAPPPSCFCVAMGNVRWQAEEDERSQSGQQNGQAANECHGLLAKARNFVGRVEIG